MDSFAQGQGQRRSERRKKGASLMWINSRIIACSEQGSIEELLSLIAQHMPQMNLVNLTTAIHRLGKMVSHDARSQSQLKQSPVFDDLRMAIVRTLTKWNPNDIQPQSLSNILWALASTRTADMQIVSLACDRALLSLHRFKSFELATTLWAIAKLSTFDACVQVNVMPLSMLFEEASKYVVDNIAHMEFRCLSMVAWAFATVRIADYRMFACIARPMTRTARTASCQEMGNSVWAFGTLNIPDDELFAALANEGISQLDNFKPQELSNMLWGFANTGFFHQIFFKRAAAAAKYKELSAQHLANILWSFSRAGPQHSLTQQTVLSFLPECCKKFDSFKAQELSSVALSIAKAFVDQRTALPSSVVDFFIECIPAAMLYDDLSNYSDQSLTNMVTAFAMVGMCDSYGPFPALGEEAVRRSHDLQPAQLLRLFRTYLAAEQYCKVAGVMAMRLADHVNGLRARDLRSLSHTCIEYFGLKRSSELNRQELRALCLQVAQEAARGSSGLENAATKLRFGDWEVERTSATTTEPRSPVSELSDSVEETLACHWQDGPPPGASLKTWTPSERKHIRHSFFASETDRTSLCMLQEAPCTSGPVGPRPVGLQASMITRDLNSSLRGSKGCDAGCHIFSDARSTAESWQAQSEQSMSFGTSASRIEGFEFAPAQIGGAYRDRFQDQRSDSQNSCSWEFEASCGMCSKPKNTDMPTAFVASLVQQLMKPSKQDPNGMAQSSPDAFQEAIRAGNARFQAGASQPVSASQCQMQASSISSSWIPINRGCARSNEIYELPCYQEWKYSQASQIRQPPFERYVEQSTFDEHMSNGSVALPEVNQMHIGHNNLTVDLCGSYVISHDDIDGGYATDDGF